MHYRLTIYPSLSQYVMTIDCKKTDEHLSTRRKQTFVQITIPTNIHTANIIFTNSILMEDKYNIPKGKMYSNHWLYPTT